MRIWQLRSSHFPSGERRGTNYREVQRVYRPKIPLSACHLGEIEYKKKNVRTQWQIILYFSNLLGCAGTGRCSRLCQVPTAIPVNAQINYCLRLFFSVVTPPVSKTFIKNRSCASQSRGANSDLKTGEVGFTFQSRHFIWGFWLSPHKSCFVHWHWDVLVPLNQYINSYFRKKQILIEKSWESVGAFSSLISQRSCPTEPDFLLIESSKPVIHLP